MPYELGVREKNGTHYHLESAIDAFYGKTFSALGDSIVWAGAPMLGRMRGRLGFKSYRNLGVSGRPMADGTSAGAGTVTTALANTFSGDAMIYIAAGTNDFRLDVPLGLLGAPGDAAGSFVRSTFYGAYRATLNFIQAQAPDARIVLATPLQRNNSGYSTTTTNAAGHMLRDYRAAIFALADMHSLPVVDMYALSGISERNLSLFTSDGLHPNDRGYKRMADVAVDQIRGGGSPAPTDGADWRDAIIALNAAALA